MRAEKLHVALVVKIIGTAPGLSSFACVVEWAYRLCSSYSKYDIKAILVSKKNTIAILCSLLTFSIFGRLISKPTLPTKSDFT